VISTFCLVSSRPLSAGGGGVDILAGVDVAGLARSPTDLFDEEAAASVAGGSELMVMAAPKALCGDSCGIGSLCWRHGVLEQEIWG
jgi:hypothetical protein